MSKNNTLLGQDLSNIATINPENMLSKIGLALVPFTPVSITGSEALYGWGRLAIYGALTYATYSKHRKLSYVLGTATAISLFSSLAGKAWNNGKA